MNRKISLFILLPLFIFGCKDDPIPKPKAQLRLDYPEADFTEYEGPAYSFQYNKAARISETNNKALTVDYQNMKGAIYLTYNRVDDNLDALLSDAQRFSYEHVVKADAILEQPFVNDDAGVYGMFYEVKGDAASQAQFYVTDSTEHFLTGSLYFYAKPNYDSIYPAAVYLQNDIRHIMETLRWK